MSKHIKRHYAATLLLLNKFFRVNLIWIQRLKKFWLFLLLYMYINPISGLMSMYCSSYCNWSNNKKQQQPWRYCLVKTIQWMWASVLFCFGFFILSRVFFLSKFLQAATDLRERGSKDRIILHRIIRSKVFCFFCKFDQNIKSSFSVDQQSSDRISWSKKKERKIKSTEKEDFWFTKKWQKKFLIL